MTETLIVNELLAFLQQKLDVMDEVSAVQICKSAFTQEDIAAAKSLLFKSLNKSDKMVSHRRDGTPKSLQEIITLLKETDPDHVPTFVVKELRKLPPVTPDHIDVTCLLKDILFLKASLEDVMTKLEASENNVFQLRKEVDELRTKQSVPVSTRSSDDAPFVNTRRRGAHVNTSAVCADSAKSKSPILQNASRSIQIAAICAAPDSAVSIVQPKNAQNIDSEIMTPGRNFASVVASNRVSQKKPPSKPTLVAVPNKPDEDGFIKVQRKRRRQRVCQNRCGVAPTGPNFLLRAATPTTALYLSRLHFTTKEQEINEYIQVKSNFNLRVQHLQSTHYTGFKSFVVRVPTAKKDLFLKEDFWPKGVVYRKFRGRIPARNTIASAHTT